MEKKYIFDNKIYNITTSTKLYEYSLKENTGMTWMGGLPILKEIKNVIYKSAKERLYEVRIDGDRLSIQDIAEVELKRLLKKRNGISLLKELYPETLDELEEV